MMMFLIILVSVANFWIYKIFQDNLILALLIFIESLLLFRAVFLKDHSLSKIVFVLLSIIAVYLLTNNFDKNIFKNSDLENIKIFERREYYSKELGKIYRNRFGLYYFNNLRLYFNKLNENLFSNLDFNSYFSTSNEKYPIILGPFFIIGFFYLLVNLQKNLAVYTLATLALSAVTKAGSGPILLFPIINVCIALGAIKLLYFFKKRK